MIKADDLVGQRQRRLDNLTALQKLGIEIYPSKSEKTIANQTIIADFGKWEGKTIVQSGRLVSWRDHGKMVFADLLDQSGKIQLWLKKDVLKKDLKHHFLGWEELKLIDNGDIVEVEGQVTKTTGGQVSLLVSKLRLLAKSLRPIPWSLEDKEQLLRRRYLDLNINPEKKALFLRKAKFWEAQRDFLKKHGFIEVETPVLEHVTGGADARPFTTFHNDLNETLYLRISTELFQKRLITAGFEKIYTFGPNFRNEGISEEHLQEFYQIEWYWAYASYRENMILVRDLFRHLAKTVYGKTKFKSRGHEFDLSQDWQEIDYAQIIKERFKIDIFNSDDKEILAVLQKNKVELPGVINRNRLVDNLWKLIRKTISGPAFLVNEPAFMSPLAKSRVDNPQLTERFHVIIAGSELGNGYSEINDPKEQLQRFIDQQKLREKGDREAQMLDLDFVEMLEYGMPPVSGYGQSERIFWALEDITSREGVLFPLMAYSLGEHAEKIYNPSVIKYAKHN
jgi:lysyl-tRNA synthetase class 2